MHRATEVADSSCSDLPSIQAAQDLGEDPPSYWLVYRIVAALPADLVTLAHEGTKAYGNAFAYRSVPGAFATWAQSFVQTLATGNRELSREKLESFLS